MTISRQSQTDLSAQHADRLVAYVAQLNLPIVAFSGGVDSAVVAAAAFRSHGEQALAVTAISPSLANTQRQRAREVAIQIGILHQEVVTDEVSLPQYRRNDGQRCFFCKQTLYSALTQVAQKLAIDMADLLSGTNHDDLGDYRPGIQAGTQAGVRSPLADLGLSKADVRRLARHWNLPVWDVPASPCLSSRIAYGVEVTVERLQRVEAAEDFLAQRGFSPMRVRLHADDLARIEVTRAAIAELLAPPLWDELVRHFLQLGFRYVTIDMQAFRSGSLNPLVTLQSRK